jgi:Flp pilus assembly protein TadB
LNLYDPGAIRDEYDFCCHVDALPQRPPQGYQKENPAVRRGFPWNLVLCRALTGLFTGLLRLLPWLLTGLLALLIGLIAVIALLRLALVVLAHKNLQSKI